MKSMLHEAKVNKFEIIRKTQILSRQIKMNQRKNFALKSTISKIKAIIINNNNNNRMEMIEESL